MSTPEEAFKDRERTISYYLDGQKLAYDERIKYDRLKTPFEGQLTYVLSEDIDVTGKAYIEFALVRSGRAIRTFRSSSSKLVV